MQPILLNLPNTPSWRSQVDSDRGNEMMVLGGEEERRLRNAARLAKQVKKYAGSLVQV